MGCQSVLSRLKDRSFQSLIIWIIVILVVIIVVPIDKTPGALVACVLLSKAFL